jgi:LysM repeat protein
VVLGLGVIVALVLAVLASAALLLGPGATPAAASGDKTVHAKATIVTVRSGETLWSIANRVAPAADPRETVMALQELNNLASPTVYVGERLIIPMAR